MGSFYVNFTVRGPSQRQIVGYLKYARRSAYVSPTIDGATLVFDERADTEYDCIEELAEQLSQALSSPVLAAAVNDSDVLMYWLFERGQLLDDYNSWPGYGEDERGKPVGGDAAVLCAAFAKPDRVRAVDFILHHKVYQWSDELHRELARLLDLPLKNVNDGYRTIQANLLFDEDNGLVRVG